MSRNTISRLRQDIEEKASARRTETYETINIRPGAKITAMIELLAELRGVPLSSMLTDDLSEKLAQYAASDPRHAPIILDVAEAFLTKHGQPSHDSALGQLVAQGLLDIKTDNPMIRSLEAKLFSIRSTRKPEGDA